MSCCKPVANAQASLSRHELLIDTILTEQDELVEAHRQQIDEIMELVKDEMEVLRSELVL